MLLEGLLVIFLAVIICVLVYYQLNAKIVLPRIDRQNTVNYLRGLNFILEDQPDKAIDEFIKALKVDTETIETHIALGSLFRRRGEVDRAIRIHQNLIARPQLNKPQRVQAIYELAKDYLSAGVLDRAERLFLEVIDSGLLLKESLQQLLDIYQREQAWDKAIKVACRLNHLTADGVADIIAHYYCEMAANATAASKRDEARALLRKALATDRQCIRALIMLADEEFDQQRYRSALSYYRKVIVMNSRYVTQLLPRLEVCFTELRQADKFIQLLQSLLQEQTNVNVELALANQLYQREGIARAIDFITGVLQAKPSMQSLSRLIELQAQESSSEKFKAILHQVNQTLSKVATREATFQCQSCGFNGNKMHWLCPGCRQWGKLQPSM